MWSSVPFVSSLLPPPGTSRILVNLSALLSPSCVTPAWDLYHLPSQGFFALRSSGQSSQAICEFTAREAVLSYCGRREEEASYGLCCLRSWKKWDCRPVWGPRPGRCLVGRAATAHVFLCLISSRWAKPGRAARVIFASGKARWGQFEGQRMAWCAQFHLPGSLWGRLASLAVWCTAGVLLRATGFSHSREGCLLISSSKCLTFSTREFRENFSLLPCFPVWIPPTWMVLQLSLSAISPFDSLSFTQLHYFTQ